MEQTLTKKQEQMLTQTLGITDKIFRQAVLISPSVGFWDGKVQQTEEDLVAQESKTRREIYTPGSKWLVPKDSIQRFFKYRTKLQHYMRNMSFDFPLRGVRFVPKENLPLVVKQLKEFKQEFFTHVEDFCIKYPGLKDRQINLFNREYPNKKGQLDKYYPSVEALRSKFHFDWTVFTWSVSRLEEVVAEECDRFSGKMTGFIQGCAVALRDATVEICEQFSSSIGNAKKKVNERSVESFENFLVRFQALNFMKDEELSRAVAKAREVFYRVDFWTVEAAEAVRMQDVLHEVIVIASNQQNALTTANLYLRRLTVDELTPEELNVPEEQEIMTNRMSKEEPRFLSSSEERTEPEPALVRNPEAHIEIEH